MSRLTLLFALPALAMALSACDDKSSGDDDDDSFGDDGSDGTSGWGDGADGGGSGGDGADGGSGGDGADGGSGGGGAPRPVEGTWSVSDFNLLSDPCGLAAFQDPGELVPSTLRVAHVGSADFTVSGDGGDPSSCSAQSSGAYTCGVTQSEQALTDFGIDATMLIESGISGSTSSDGLDWEVVTSVDIVCEGSGCVIMESLGLSFPCSQELELTTAAP